MEPLFLSMMFNNSVASYFICKLIDRLFHFIIKKKAIAYSFIFDRLKLHELK